MVLSGRQPLPKSRIWTGLDWFGRGCCVHCHVSHVEVKQKPGNEGRRGMRRHRGQGYPRVCARNSYSERAPPSVGNGHSSARDI